MNALLRVFALFVGLLVAGLLHAVEVADLYGVSVPVTSQSVAEREPAILDGLKQVLVKVSGQAAVLDLPAVQEALKKASVLLASYRYETASVRSPASGLLRLRLAFEPSAVRAILNRAGAPVWGSGRPLLYVSVARMETRGEMPLVLGTPQADTLSAVAIERGIPLLLPTSGATAGGDMSAVLAAAARGGAKAALQAVLAGGGNRFRVSGTLVVDGQSEAITAAGADESSALRELVVRAADRLGARYAVVSQVDQLRVVRLRVSGVNTLPAHAALEDWLAGLPLVKDVVVERLSGEGVAYLLTLAGGVDRLQQAMASDGRFAVIGDPVVEADISGGSIMVLDAGLGSAGLRP